LKAGGYSIRARYHVLRDLTVSMGTGQFHVLVGRNGAGKSTLLRILGRRERADSGEGMLLGRPLGDDLAEHGHDVAFVRFRSCVRSSDISYAPTPGG
jgi:ABC-type multidrug transport system ATPase subunit